MAARGLVARRDERVALLASRVGPVQTAQLVKAIPQPSAYSYELKWDGYRIVAVRAGGDVRLVSRKGQDYTAELAPVAADVAALGVDECVLDGEVCALDPRGRPSFQLLQNRGRRRAPIVFFVFDILWLDGEDLRHLPIEERRARLERVVGPHDRSGSLVLSTAADGDPEAILRLACDRGLEGIVAKRKGSTYGGGRSASWLKLKCQLRQEFAIVGYLPLRETERSVGGLLLGLREGDGYRYAGKVGTGFDDATRVRLAKLLDAHAIGRAPAAGVPRFDGVARFTEPRLVCEVAFTEWTEGGHVRHPSFQGLRRDKSPDECVRENAAEPPPVRAVAAAPAPRAAGERVDVAGVSISKPGRVLDPAGVTKLELARWYEAIGPWMLPHVAGRPLSLVRWAGGKATEKGGVYLRHARAWGPDVLRRVRIREKTKTGEYLVADTVAALVGLAQMDILEIHAWNSVADDVERPDRIVFDLDPSPELPWDAVAEAASYLRDRLAALGLASWVKTTGGKGLHVVVPLAPSADWDGCFAFSRAVAQLLVRERPGRFVASVTKAARHGKILIDYLRNNRANTSVAAYSIRARPGAPVSVPIGWDEIDDDPRARPWTMERVLARVKSRRSDPWRRYFKTAQTLPG